MPMVTVRSAVLATVVAGAVVFAACGGDSGDDSTAEPTETTEPTASATSDDGGGDGAVLFGGKEVGEFYTLNCSACHGASREGITGLGLPLLPDVLAEDDDFYRDTIRSGRTGTVMPAWGDTGMTENEITALIAFIRTAP